MSNTRRPEEVDLEGDIYKAIRLPTQPNGAVIDVDARKIASLDKPRAIRLAVFLLDAAGLDLVSSARKVVAGHAARLAALEPDTVDAKEYQAALNDRDDGIEDLASVLEVIDEKDG